MKKNDCNLEEVAKELFKIKNEATEKDFIEIILLKCDKKKRKASSYNVFIGQCMKNGNGMKDCSDNWKQMNESEKKDYR